MIYQSFHDYWPDIAESETRCLTIFNDAELPPGTYVFIESYCNDPRCDCRRVFLSVYHCEKREFLAVIAYGWESQTFYAKWMGDDDPETIQGLKGPCLNLSSPQSPLAPVLLRKLNLILDDKNYVEKLKRHYKMFKKAVRKKRRSQEGSSIQNRV